MKETKLIITLNELELAKLLCDIRDPELRDRVGQAVLEFMMRETLKVKNLERKARQEQKEKEKEKEKESLAA